MANTDASSKAPESTDNKRLDEIRGEMQTELSSIKEQLASMNQQYTQGLAEIKTAVTPKVETQIEDEDFFDPKTLRKKILNEATQVADSMIRDNRKKDTMIYQLAQEYPELSTDRALQNDILAAQQALPASMQDTAEGYEMAVLKAIAKKGILPKSKRPVVDEDIASGGARSASGKPDRSKAKVSEKTLAIAELLRGRTLTEEEQKSLASTVKRDTFSRYR